MGAEGTRNMYSKLAVNNKYDCLKLHHVGYLIKLIQFYLDTSLHLWIPNVTWTGYMFCNTMLKILNLLKVKHGAGIDF
jgi:hypothetical protein